MHCKTTFIVLALQLLMLNACWAVLSSWSHSTKHAFISGKNSTKTANVISMKVVFNAKNQGLIWELVNALAEKSIAMGAVVLNTVEMPKDLALIRTPIGLQYRLSYPTFEAVRYGVRANGIDIPLGSKVQLKGFVNFKGDMFRCLNTNAYDNCTMFSVTGFWCRLMCLKGHVKKGEWNVNRQQKWFHQLKIVKHTSVERPVWVRDALFREANMSQSWVNAAINQTYSPSCVSKYKAVPISRRTVAVTSVGSNTTMRQVEVVSLGSVSCIDGGDLSFKFETGKTASAQVVKSTYGSNTFSFEINCKGKCYSEPVACLTGDGLAVAGEPSYSFESGKAVSKLCCSSDIGLSCYSTSGTGDISYEGSTFSTKAKVCNGSSCLDVGRKIVFDPWQLEPGNLIGKVCLLYDPASKESWLLKVDKAGKIILIGKAVLRRKGRLLVNNKCSDTHLMVLHSHYFVDWGIKYKVGQRCSCNVLNTPNCQCIKGIVASDQGSIQLNAHSYHIYNTMPTKTGMTYANTLVGISKGTHQIDYIPTLNVECSASISSGRNRGGVGLSQELCLPGVEVHQDPIDLQVKLYPVATGMCAYQINRDPTCQGTTVAPTRKRKRRKRDQNGGEKDTVSMKTSEKETDFFREALQELKARQMSEQDLEKERAMYSLFHEEDEEYDDDDDDSKDMEEGEGNRGKGDSNWGRAMPLHLVTELQPILMEVNREVEVVHHRHRVAREKPIPGKDYNKGGNLKDSAKGRICYGLDDQGRSESDDGSCCNCDYCVNHRGESDWNAYTNLKCGCCFGPLQKDYTDEFNKLSDSIASTLAYAHNLSNTVDDIYQVEVSEQGEINVTNRNLKVQQNAIKFLGDQFIATTKNLSAWDTQQDNRISELANSTYQQENMEVAYRRAYDTLLAIREDERDMADQWGRRLINLSYVAPDSTIFVAVLINKNETFMSALINLPYANDLYLGEVINCDSTRLCVGDHRPVINENSCVKLMNGSVRYVDSLECQGKKCSAYGMIRSAYRLMDWEPCYPAIHVDSQGLTALKSTNLVFKATIVGVPPLLPVTLSRGTLYTPPCGYSLDKHSIPCKESEVFKIGNVPDWDIKVFYQYFPKIKEYIDESHYIPKDTFRKFVNQHISALEKEQKDNQKLNELQNNEFKQYANDTRVKLREYRKLKKKSDAAGVKADRDNEQQIKETKELSEGSEVASEERHTVLVEETKHTNNMAIAVLSIVSVGLVLLVIDILAQFKVFPCQKANGEDFTAARNDKIYAENRLDQRTANEHWLVFFCQLYLQALLLSYVAGFNMTKVLGNILKRWEFCYYGFCFSLPLSLVMFEHISTIGALVYISFVLIGFSYMGRVKSTSKPINISGLRVLLSDEFLRDGIFCGGSMTAKDWAVLLLFGCSMLVTILSFFNAYRQGKLRSINQRILSGRTYVLRMLSGARGECPSRAVFELGNSFYLVGMAAYGYMIKCGELKGDSNIDLGDMQKSVVDNSIRGMVNEHIRSMIPSDAIRVLPGANGFSLNPFSGLGQRFTEIIVVVGIMIGLVVVVGIWQLCKTQKTSNQLDSLVMGEVSMMKLNQAERLRGMANSSGPDMVRVSFRNFSYVTCSLPTPAMYANGSAVLLGIALLLFIYHICTWRSSTSLMGVHEVSMLFSEWACILSWYQFHKKMFLMESIVEVSIHIMTAMLCFIVCLGKTVCKLIFTGLKCLSLVGIWLLCFTHRFQYNTAFTINSTSTSPTKTNTTPIKTATEIVTEVKTVKVYIKPQHYQLVTLCLLASFLAIVLIFIWMVWRKMKSVSESTLARFHETEHQPDCVVGAANYSARGDYPDALMLHLTDGESPPNSSCKVLFAWITKDPSTLLPIIRSCAKSFSPQNNDIILKLGCTFPWPKNPLSSPILKTKNSVSELGGETYILIKGIGSKCATWGIGSAQLKSTREDLGDVKFDSGLHFPSNKVVRGRSEPGCTSYASVNVASSSSVSIEET